MYGYLRLHNKLFQAAAASNNKYLPHPVSNNYKFDAHLDLEGAFNPYRNNNINIY